MRAQGIAQFGVVLQPAQRLVPARDEGVHQFGVVAGTDDGFQVGPDGLGRILGTGGARLIGAIQPCCSAGDRRGTAKVFGLFHHQDLQAQA
ncbi:hypothetical protein D3C73_1224790 [compost metagenome]